MDLLNEVPVTLVVKAPNQKVADQTVECALNWTVRKLKEHLALVYPSNPNENQQKIIYSGRLLQDDVTLKDVLQQHNKSETIHTVHLVCCNSSTDGSTSQNTLNMSYNPLVTTTTTEGLRNRRTAPLEMHQQQETRPEQQQQQVQDQSSAVTGDVAEHFQLPSSAFQPPYHNPFMSAYLPSSPVGTASQTPANNSAYSIEQMLWLQQQAYFQYMTSYVHLFQQGGVSMAAPYNQPASPFTTPANQDAGQDRAANAIERPALAQRPPVVLMNAQGGPVNDDDDDEMDRDWLDRFYVGVRFVLLLSILYFYSTPTRFIITFLLMLFVYLFQVGWFRVIVRLRGEAAPAPANPAAVPAPPPAAVDPNNQPDERTPTDTGVAAPEEPRPLGGLELAWSVFVAFFTSLAPQPPAPVNAN